MKLDLLQKAKAELGIPRADARRPGRLRKSFLVPPLVLAAWEALSRGGAISAAILPAPSAVVVRWWQYLAPLEPYDPARGSRLAWVVSGELPQDALGSLYRVVTGFLIGGGLALPLGLLMGRIPLVHELLRPGAGDRPPDPAHRLHPALHPLVRARRSARALPHRAGRLLPRAGEHHRRRAQRRRHLHPRRAEPGRGRGDALPARDPAGGHALRPHRGPGGHRRGLHRGDRRGDDGRQQGARLPHPGGARVHVVGQDHRRDDHHRAVRARDRPRDGPAQPWLLRWHRGMES